MPDCIIFVYIFTHKFASNKPARTEHEQVKLVHVEQIMHLHDMTSCYSYDR